MAHVYVRSGAGGAATGADWANAYLTLAAALTAKAAGDQFWVSEDHSETTSGNITFTSPGTAAAPCTIACVNHAGTVPPVSADLAVTAIVASTSNSQMAFAGYAYCYGIEFRCSSSTNTPTIISSASAASFWIYKSSLLNLNGSSATGLLTFGTGATGSISCRADLIDTVIKFANVAQAISLNSARVFMRGGSVSSGGSFPTSLIATSPRGGEMVLEGVDLSSLGAGKTLVAAISAASTIYFKDCKLNASVTIAATPGAPGAGLVKLIRSDSGAANYRHEKYAYAGTQTVETTIVRTGGASDGATPVAAKLVTTANSKWYMPFEALPLVIWNDVIGVSRVVTVEGIWGGGAVPNNDDIWIDVEYLGSASFPTGSFATSSKADLLATNAALTAGTGTWGGSTTKFKTSVTITPQQKGPIYVYVKAATASTTFYIDPKPVLSLA